MITTREFLFRTRFLAITQSMGLLLMASGFWPHLNNQSAPLYMVSGAIVVISSIGLIEVVNRDRRVHHLAMEQLQREANSDGLTEIANRRSLTATLSDLLSVDKDPLVAVAMIDVDHFKEYNDSYGHQAGDEVLKQLATALTIAVRTSDTVARLGGDEFVVAIEDIEPWEIAPVARRLQLCGDDVSDVLELSETLTLSIGIAIAQHGDSPRSVLARADQAMYAAKAHGRGCGFIESDGDVSPIETVAKRFAAPIAADRDAQRDDDLTAGRTADRIADRTDDVLPGSGRDKLVERPPVHATKSII